MKRILDIIPLAIAGAALAIGCGPKAGAPGAGGGAAPSVAAKDLKRCGPEALIDDGEDNNNQVTVQDGRAGYWYTFVDNAGTTIEPAAGGTYTMREGGANGSGMAACMKGKIAANGSPLYAGLGFNFVDPKDAYDASKYGGIAFFAKRSATSYPKVRMKVPDMNTDPQAGICTQCFNDFGMDLELTDQWVEYALMFDSAKQMPYWGNPTPPKITPEKIFGVQWQVNKNGMDYDVCFDDVSFVGCGG